MPDPRQVRRQRWSSPRQRSSPEPRTPGLGDPRLGDPEQRDPGPERPAGAAPPARAELWRLLELVALCGFVVVQPLLEIIGDSPGFFLFHGVTGAEIMALVALFTVVPPALLWSAGALSRLAGPVVRGRVHLATVALLVALFMIQVGKHVTPWRGVLLTLVAVLVAAAVVAGYVRFDATRQLLRFAAVGPVVFVLLFTFASPAAAVVFPGDSPGAALAPRVVGPNPPVVMILFDELPLVSLLDADGGVDAERFPNFARLADGSTWYRNATAAAGWTPHALPAMLSGRWPEADVAAHYSEYPDNLFTLLGEVYQVEAIETISELCPPWQCGDRAGRAHGGLPTALAETSTLLGEIVSPAEPAREVTAGFREPNVAELGPRFRFQQARAENRPARFLEFLDWVDPEAAAADSRPSLRFLHLLLPHSPWVHLPSGTRYEAPHLPLDGDWWSQLAHQRHLAQLEYTDLLLGEALEALVAAGVYDDAVVVVTSDHGHSFTPGSAGRRMDDSDQAAAQLAWVPMFVKEPGQVEPVVDDRNWQQVDLLPTLADLAGVEVPWEVDGISWGRQERTEGEKIYYEYEDLSDRRVLDGPRLFEQILRDPAGFPALPPAPLPELVGEPVTGLPVSPGPVGAQVEGPGTAAEVRPEEGTVPALVYGTLPAAVPEGAPVAIAVNGTIGAVVPAVAGAEGTLRFAGLINDESLFRTGENRLELFRVEQAGADVRLQRLGLD